MPMCPIPNGSQREQHKQFAGCILHYQYDPLILKEIEIFVGLSPSRCMVSSEIGTIYITSSREVLQGAETYFVSFIDPES